MMTPIRSRLEGIKRLCTAFEREPRPAWYYRTTFGMNRAYGLRGRELRVNFNVHVVPPGHDEGVFTSSVTVWPPGRKRRGNTRLWNGGSKKPGGWNLSLRQVNWYADCERLLRTYGYRGKWRHSPWGRFGDFWKRHPDSKTLAAEPALLETLSDEQFWGRRRTTR
jgi:hypothetical protein